MRVLVTCSLQLTSKLQLQLATYVSHSQIDVPLLALLHFLLRSPPLFAIFIRFFSESPRRNGYLIPSVTRCRGGNPWHFEAKSVPDASALQSASLFTSDTCSGGSYIHTYGPTDKRDLELGRKLLLVLVQYPKFGVGSAKFSKTPRLCR